MKIWCISDTHNKHEFLEVPKGIDMVIHSGDASSQKIPALNEHELLNFLHWFGRLDIKYKIFVPGNHDTSLEDGLVRRSDIPESVIYLEHESVEIEGIKIFGSPYTPAFGSNWAFNVPRSKLKVYWDEIPADTDILIVHGPPKGILDLTQYDTRPGGDGNSLFQCGCKFLLDRIKEIQPKYNIFGHIHSEKNCPNSGILKISGCETTFINAAVCDFDRSDAEVKKKELVHNGFVITY